MTCRAVFVLGAIGAAYLLGRWPLGDWRARHEPNPASASSAKLPSAVNGVHPPKSGSYANSLTLDDARNQISGILAGTMPKWMIGTSRREAFRELADMVNPADIPALLAAFKDLPQNQDKTLLFQSLLFDLQKSNPAAALAFYQWTADPVLHQQGVEFYYGSLALSDLPQALREMAQLPPGPDAQAAYDAVIKNLSHGGRSADAAAVAASLPDGPQRDSALASVGVIWARADVQAALNWALSLPSTDDAAFGKILAAVGQIKPELAIANLDKVADPAERDAVITSVARAVQKQDSAAALDWINQTASGTTRDTLVAGVFAGLTQPPVETTPNANGGANTIWRLNQPNVTAAVSLLGNVSDPDVRATAIASIADGWRKTDPTAALAWAQSLPETDATARNDALNSIVASLSKTDPAAALNDINNSADPSVFLPSAPAVAQNLATANLSAALAWTNNLPDGVAKTNALSNVLNVQAQTDFAGAWNYAANLTPGDSQNTILSNLISTEASKDPAQASQFLDKIPTATAQLSAATALAAVWVKQDPQAFTIWLNGLPPGDVRDTAIAQLVSSPQAAKNPDGVMAWVNSISNPATKAALTQKLAQATK